MGKLIEAKIREKDFKKLIDDIIKIAEKNNELTSMVVQLLDNPTLIAISEKYYNK